MIPRFLNRNKTKKLSKYERKDQKNTDQSYQIEKRAQEQFQKEHPGDADKVIRESGGRDISAI
jgi:hypothetical protein